jgi:hypothetical protein
MMDDNQDSLDRCQLTIPNLTAQFKPLNITVGDLFATGKELAFISLASNLYTGSLAGIGFLIGGLAGGLSTNLSNKQNLEAARGTAQTHRQDDFGMSLQERLQNYQGLVIPRKNISSIEVRGSVVRIVHTGGSLDLGSDNPRECQAKLESWRRGELESEEDPQGINLGLPPAAKLLVWLEDGSISRKLTAPILSALSSQKDYLKAFFQLFDRLKFPKKKAVVNSVGLLPINLGAVFQDHLEEARRIGRRALYWTLLVLVFGIFSVIYQTTSLISSGPKDTSLLDLLTIFGVLSLVFSIPLEIFHLTQIGKDKLLCEMAADRLGRTPV